MRRVPEESSTQQQASGEELIDLDKSNSQSLRQRAVYPRFTRDVEARIVARVLELPWTNLLLN
jgi:hypothetical protein